MPSPGEEFQTLAPYSSTVKDVGNASAHVRPERPRVWTSFAVIAASLVTFMVASLLLTAIAVVVVHGVPNRDMMRDPAFLMKLTQSRFGFLLVVVAPQLALIIPCIAAAVWSPVAFRKRLGLVRGHWPFWAWGCAMFATPLVGTLSGVVSGLFLAESKHLNDLGGIFRELGESGFLIPMTFLIGAAPAICEELLFRGYVQTRLSTSLGPVVGIFLASFFFAAFHLDFVHVVSVFPIGVFLGWVSFRSGSLVPSMLGHFLNNALGVVIMVNAPEDAADTLAMPAAVFLTWILFAGILGVLGTIAASVLYKSKSGSTFLNAEFATAELVPAELVPAELAPAESVPAESVAVNVSPPSQEPT